MQKMKFRSFRNHRLFFSSSYSARLTASFGLSGIEMEFNFGLLFLLALITQGYTIQVPLTEASQRFFSSSNSNYSTGVLISENTDKYVKTLLEKWGSSCLSIAVVRKDESTPNGWRHEFGSYGIAHADGSPMTPDSVFSIASNGKIFLQIPCDVGGFFDFQQNSG